MSILLRQVKVVDSASAFNNKVVDILIENGKISEISKSITKKARKIIAIKSLHTAPGFVDVFADYREPGYEHKETIQTGLKVAAAGGFTDVLLVPNTAPTLSTKSAIQFILKKAAGDIVVLHPFGSITQNIEGKTLAEMLDMKHHGAIAFTDGWKPLQNANLMLKALEYVKAFDGVVVQIPLDTSLSEGGLMHEGAVSTKIGMSGVPVLAETTLLQRDIELLRYTNSRLHVTGISTEEGVNQIRKAKKEGLHITCSVTPYHLALTDEALKNYDSVYKVSPVLRSEKDRQALIKGLKDGTIDCIASHHRPQEWDAKTKEFEYASDGMNVQENTFSIVWDTIADKVPLERVVEAFSITPRKIFNLPRAEIKEGAIAALSLFLPDSTTVLQEKNIQSLSRNNPFISKELKGKIVGIIHKNQSSLNTI